MQLVEDAVVRTIDLQSPFPGRSRGTEGSVVIVGLMLMSDGRAEAASSIDEPEARRLAQFLLEPQLSALPLRLVFVVEWLRARSFAP